TGGLIVDDTKKLVVVDDEEISLTATEYNILKFLISNLEQVFTANQIYEHVWNEPAFDVGKIISVHIRHLREKIEINPKEPRYLKIVYGLGYKVVKIS
ncbi:MAG: response regulator transcription factor, partial [Oscillospiraceae bacterium]